LAIVADQTGMKVGDIFFNMPLRSVHAYQHCYMVANGVECRYPKGGSQESGLDGLQNISKQLKEKIDG